MSMNNHNWFEDNILQKSLREEANGEVKMRTHATCNGISPLDISTIKHIYEKALLISKLEEEAQNNDLGFDMASKLDNLSDSYDSDLSLESITAGKLDTSPNSQHENKLDTSQTYIKTREENSRLRLLLNVREEELSMLREKYKNQETELQTTRADLEELQRLKEKTNDKKPEDEDRKSKLPYRNCHMLTRIEILEQDLKYCQDARDRLAKEVLRLEKDFNLEREARAKLESNLHAMIQEKQKDILILEENWKSLHQNEVARLKRTIDELNHKLSREEDIRRCVQMGLDSLQRHFTRTSPPNERSRTPKFNGGK